MARPVRPLINDAKKAIYLANLEKGMPVKEAAKAAGTTSVTVAAWRKDDPLFDLDCDLSSIASLEVLRKAAVSRAVDGVKEYLYHNGRPIYLIDDNAKVTHAFKINYSDTMLVHLLQSRDPIRHDSRVRAMRFERLYRQLDEKLSGDEAVADDELVDMLDKLAAAKAATA